MIAQWDSSLSVLPVARAMITQWENECISVSVLPVARVMIAQWDSSLFVLPVARVMIALWNSSLSVLPVPRVQFLNARKNFKGFFCDWSHSANPSWASVAENDSISSQWAVDTKKEGLRPFYGQMMTGKNPIRVSCRSECWRSEAPPRRQRPADNKCRRIPWCR